MRIILINDKGMILGVNLGGQVVMNRLVKYAIVILLLFPTLAVVRDVVGDLDIDAPLAKSPFDASTAVDFQKQTATYLGEPVVKTIDLGFGAHIEFRLIPAGEFDMGSLPGELERDDDESPIRRVINSKPFYLGTCEVTQSQWKAVMGNSLRLSHFKGPDFPADGIQWADAVKFCQRLSEREHETFRLPTEAEWEFACRAGSTTSFSFGDDSSSLSQYAWFNSNSDSQTHPVGRKKPNAFGLHDMHGNVWEWCSDWYDEYHTDSTVDPKGPADGITRVLRGGSWFCTPGLCRSANRGFNNPDTRDDDVGFRIVMECPQ